MKYELPVAGWYIILQYNVVHTEVVLYKAQQDIAGQSCVVAFSEFLNVRRYFNHQSCAQKIEIME